MLSESASCFDAGTCCHTHILSLTLCSLCAFFYWLGSVSDWASDTPCMGPDSTWQPPFPFALPQYWSFLFLFPLLFRYYSFVKFPGTAACIGFSPTPMLQCARWYVRKKVYDVWLYIQKSTTTVHVHRMLVFSFFTRSSKRSGSRLHISGLPRFCHSTTGLLQTSCFLTQWSGGLTSNGDGDKWALNVRHA